MLPAPPAEQVPPPDPAHVHVTPVSEDGTGAVTVVPLAGFGPLFVAVIAYVRAWPGVAVVRPSVFVIARSAGTSSVSASVALLLVGSGSVIPAGTATVAVFDI